MVTIKQTLSIIQIDFKRKLYLQGGKVGIFKSFLIFISPTMTAVSLYRFSHYAYHNGLGLLVHVLTIFSSLYSQCSISPAAKIMPGLVLHDIFVGIQGCTEIGFNCTFWGRNTITLGMIDGVDINSDKITIGNNCIFGFGARLMRPIQITNNINVHPNSVVLFSESRENIALFGVPARKLTPKKVTVGV